MNNELMLYSKGEVAVPRYDKRVARQAKRDFDAARAGAFRADASMAVGAHIAEGASKLILRGREMAGNDPELMMVMGKIVGNSIDQAMSVQNNMFSNWGF